MAERPVRFEFRLTDNFTGGMAAAVAAAERLSTTLALQRATWEPHDWSDFQ